MTEPEDAPVCAAETDSRLWAKERGLERPYPVICHLLDTAAIFGVLWDVVLSSRSRARIADAVQLAEPEARQVLSFWAGLHDLGKITPPFQAQVPAAFAAVRKEAAYFAVPGAEREASFRHEVATHWAVTSLLAEIGYPGDLNRMRRAVSHQVAQLLGGHHGLFGQPLLKRKLSAGSVHAPGLGEQGWGDQRRQHFIELRRVVGATALPKHGLPAELSVVVAGLIVVADWLASQTDWIKPLLPAAGWKATPQALNEHLARASHAAPGIARAAQLGRTDFALQQFEGMFPFFPNPLQRDLVEHLPRLAAERGSGLLLVTAPTGDGKTEAALYAAAVLGRVAGARGLYFALPTMATADGMFPRVAAFADQALYGERALTLLHSMAWLSPAYNGPSGTAAAARGDDAVVAERATATAAGAWLRGPKRGLLAPLGAGTIDQVLAGVLPLRYNVLRLLGVSDKVLVIDEAHAYGPWMHSLMTRLLEWLGAFGAPVVLLSATLTGSTAGSLVNAYRRGAGFLEAAEVRPCYPGWLFTDAASGQVSTPRATKTERARTVDVEVYGVGWDSLDAPGSAVRKGGRRERLRAQLRPVAEEGGTALVCCTTVAEAQATYRDLCATFPELAREEGGLRLLHSRYQARERQRISRDCERAYGKPAAGEGSRVRKGSILVATQVVEQSLDFDFDLVVSDLAPLAQLLQRVGRGRRHRRGPKGRPSWAQAEERPKLVVLEPVDSRGHTKIPPTWGTVYDYGLLVRTAELLRREQKGGIAVPGDVQRLVDAVYAADFVDGLDAAVKQELARMDLERAAKEMAESHMARMTTICAPHDVEGNLGRLSELQDGVTEELLTTRLGADTGRVLLLYTQPGGELTLEEEGTLALSTLTRRSTLTREELGLIMSQVAPVPGSWLRNDEGLPHPVGWEKQPLLRGLVLVAVNREPDSMSWRGRHGNRSIYVSSVGLEIT
ncbi:CRISPR-associated endonuclease Cas3'' [Streptomyces sp. NPDC058700]|uniref:CRISPR-associated endonuclease Cas3'' n=1 Tax=Streptomyces sp. NPDC058700 TaxID=3346607 RepID=UPI0036581850